MKRKLLRLFFLTLIWLPGTSLYADDALVLETVNQYTQALSSGDVATLRSVLGGRLYAKRRLLLEENDEYPDWLRQYYYGARFSASLSDAGSDRYPSAMLVDVITTLASGEVASSRLVLQQNSADTNWKIVDQLR